MKYIKNHWIFIIFVLGIMILTANYTYTRTDFSWVFDVNKLNMVHNGFSPLVTTLALILSNIKFLKIITYGILTLALFIIIRNIINKKNSSLIFIGTFFFFLINQNILNEAYISISGFVQCFIALIFIIIIINYLVNDNLYILPKPIIIVLGIISSLFNITYSLTVLLFLLYKIMVNYINKEKNKSLYLLFIGVAIGDVYMVFNIEGMYIGLSELSQNVLYNVVPSLLNINYIVIIITIAFLFHFAIKKYINHTTSYEKTNILLATCMICLYGFVMIISKSTYLSYLSYLFYTFSSFYILNNCCKSISFKEKIRLYYFIKLAYLFVVALVKTTINIAFLPAIIDLMILLELINILLPVNYLIVPYKFIAMFMIVTEIIISNNTEVLIQEMNRYLKRDLSCEVSHITLPSRYTEEEVSIYLPSNSQEKEFYLLYLDINKSFTYEIDFTK